MKYCICWICRYPQDISIRIAKAVAELSSRPVFIISDERCDTQVEGLSIIHIPDELCLQSHFQGSNLLIQKRVSGWDKCIYFFSRMWTEYDFVWILEDDVFFQNPTELIQLIEQYEQDEADLVATLIDRHPDSPGWPHWDTSLPFVPTFRRASLEFILRIAPTMLQRTWRFRQWVQNQTFNNSYKSFNVISRVSRRLFSEISDFVDSHQQLTFIETLFVNLAKQRKWTCRNIDRVDGIRYRPEYQQGEIEKARVGSYRIFHPVKDFSLQEMLWNPERAEPL